jgi:hypothetical protein
VRREASPVAEPRHCYDGPSPWAQFSSKQTLFVDANGVPLVIRTAPPNASDYKPILPVVTDFPDIRGKRGRPRKYSNAIYADRGCVSEGIRQGLGSQGIQPITVRRSTDHGSSHERRSDLGRNTI